MRQAIGAAYTPIAIGWDGKLYTENDGDMFVVATRGQDLRPVGSGKLTRAGLPRVIPRSIQREEPIPHGSTSPQGRLARAVPRDGLDNLFFLDSLPI